MPKDPPAPIRLPADVWSDPAVLALCRDHDANGLYRLAKRYGISNDRLAYWTGTDAAEASKRVNGKGGKVIALRRWLAIADGLDMPDPARLAIGLAPRAGPGDPAAGLVAEPRRPVPTITHPVDGKVMALVAQGAFLQGPDNAPAWLPAFYVDVTPVTEREFHRFAAATGRPGRLREPVRPEHPVTHVTYDDATAYAGWTGKCLPTAAEWEKTARGTKGTVYPWGNRPTPAKCNVRESTPGGTTPVTTYRSGASPYGVYDLCGNVWEWCSTETSPGRFALKGGAHTGAFADTVPHLTNDAGRTMADDDTGFRCIAPLATIAALFTD